MHIQAVVYGNPDYYPPMIHGAHVLSRARITQEILCSRFYTREIPEKVTTYPPNTRIRRLGSNSPQSWRNYTTFVAAALRYADPKTDLFIGYDMHGFLVARLLGWRYRRPIVYHSHDFVEGNSRVTFGQRSVMAFERRFARTADLVIVPDAYRAKVVRDQLNLEQEPLIVANAALDVPDVNSNALQLALSDRGKHFSRIVWRQGMIGSGHALEQTIRSIPYWTDPDCGFVIMGPGNDEYKQSLKILAADVGVADRFEILASVAFSDVMQFIVGASVGHCIYEPISVNHRFMTTASNKTMECMAAGLPLLLADTPENRRFIASHNNGLVVKHDDPVSIADGINLILSNDMLAQKMAEGSRAAFENEFNYAHQYRPAIERFDKLVKNDGRRRARSS